MHHRLYMKKALHIFVATIINFMVHKINNNTELNVLVNQFLYLNLHLYLGLSNSKYEKISALIKYIFWQVHLFLSLRTSHLIGDILTLSSYTSVFIVHKSSEIKLRAHK